MGQRVPPISKQLLCQLEYIGETQVVALNDAVSRSNLAAKEGPNRPHMVQSGGIVQQNRARTGRL